MIIMGIDPGSSITGFGVIDLDTKRQTTTYVTSGTIHLRPGVLPGRLQVLYEDLHAICQEFKPEVMVVEGLFSMINWRTALVMGHARGVILLVAQQHGCEIVEIQPRSAKKVITGSGSASKQMVACIVGKRLGITKVLRTDASDALALALTYMHRSSL